MTLPARAAHSRHTAVSGSWFHPLRNRASTLQLHVLSAQNGAARCVAGALGWAIMRRTLPPR
eukprot:13318155-Alexandrium_andersonii.AAC.1